MKNKITFLLLMLLSLNCFAQQHLINGTVYSADKHKPIAKVKVILHLPDSKTMEVTTDTSGTYSFKAAGPGKFYITAEKCLKGRCAMGECYMDKKFVIDSNALKQDNSIFCDLTLLPVKLKYVFPIVYFKKNSIVIENCSCCQNQKIDSALSCISELLHLNPTMQLSIDGYAETGEVEAIALSGHRATAIKNMLLKYSIDEKRIFTKGLGEKRISGSDPNNKAVNFAVVKF